MQGKGKNKRKTQKLISIPDINVHPSVFLLLLFILTLIFFHKVLSPNVLINAMDQISAGYFFREFQAWFFRNFKRFPLWDPFIFSGIPFIDAAHGDIFYLTSLFRIFIPTHVVLNWTFIMHTFLSGVTSFMLFHYISKQKLFSFIFALAFAFSGCVVSLAYPGHDGKLIFTSIFPLIVLLYLKGVEYERFYLFLINGILIGYSIFATHAQLVYYALIFLGVLWLFLVGGCIKRDRKKFFKLSFYSFVMVLLSLITSLFFLIPFQEYLSKFSPRAGEGRGIEFAKSWALPWEDYISAFIPEFSGHLENYWGHNPFKLNSEYLGALGLISLIFGFVFMRKDRYFYALITSFVLFSLIALGGSTPIFYVFYEVLPFFKRFRAHSMSFYIVTLVTFLLGVYSLKNLDTKRFKIPFITGGLIFLAFGGLGGYIADLFKSGLSTEKLGILEAYKPYIHLQGVKFSLIFLLMIGAIYLYLRNSIKPLTFSLVLGFLVLFDLWIVHNKFVKPLPHPDKLYEKDKFVALVEKDKEGPFRVFPIFYRIDENYLMLYKIESIGGHHGNQFRRYQDYIGSPHTIMFRPELLFNLYSSPKLVDMLNVKYFVTEPLPLNLESYPENIRNLLKLINNFLMRDGHEEIYRDETLLVIKNNNFLPRAYLVFDFVVIEDTARILEFMKSPEFEPKKIAIFEEPPKFKYFSPLGDSIPTWEIKFLRREPDYVKMLIKTPKSGIVVYSENYYPYIKVKVNKEETKVFNVNYIFRGFEVPPGESEVEMYFDGKRYMRGILILLGVLFFSSFLIALSIIRKF